MKYAVLWCVQVVHDSNGGTTVSDLTLIDVNTPQVCVMQSAPATERPAPGVAPTNASLPCHTPGVTVTAPCRTSSAPLLLLTLPWLVRSNVPHCSWCARHYKTAPPP
jgi:hypothetical protein